MTNTAMTRVGAFQRHFALSATVVGLACLLIWKGWYPSPLFELIGTWSVVQVLVGVDLIVGPLLTLILYKPGKRFLWFDMLVIAIIQISAFVYGMSVIYSERPCYQVFAIDRFEIIDCNTIPDEVVAAQSHLAPKHWSQPLKVVAVMPADPKQRQQLMEEVVFGGAPDLAYRPEHWLNLDDSTLEIVRQGAFEIDNLALPADAQAVVDRASARLGEGVEPLLVPMMAEDKVFTLVLDPQTTSIVDFLPLSIWDYEIRGTAE